MSDAAEYKKKIKILFNEADGLIKEIAKESVSKIEAVINNGQYEEVYRYMYS